MTDIIQNAIKTYGLQEIINSFNPIIADIMVDLYNVYEISYGKGSDGTMFVYSAVQSLVLSHSGWSECVASSLDAATKNMVKTYITRKIFDMGTQINIRRSKFA
jgi:hypothetical protein